MGKLKKGNKEQEGEWEQKVREIARDCEVLIEQILSECTKENLIIDDKLMQCQGGIALLHYQLPSGLHVYGMTQNFLPNGENQFSELWQIIVLGKEGNIYGEYEIPNCYDARRIHNRGLPQNGIFLYIDRDYDKKRQIGLGISQRQVEPYYSSRFVSADAVVISDDLVYTDVRQYDGQGVEVEKVISEDINKEAQSICDIFRAGILENGNIEDNTKSEIIRQLNELQDKLAIEGQNAELARSRKNVQSSQADVGNIGEILQALKNLEASENLLENLTKEVGEKSTDSIPGKEYEIK